MIDSLFDFSEEAPNAQDFAEAEYLIKTNFGTEYSEEKFNLIWYYVKSQAWSRERFKYAVAKFLENQHYPNWTLSDFVKFNVKLHNYEEYLELVHLRSRQGIKEVNEQIEWIRTKHGSYWIWKKDFVDSPVAFEMLKKIKGEKK